MRCSLQLLEVFNINFNSHKVLDKYVLTAYTVLITHWGMLMTKWMLYTVDCHPVHTELCLNWLDVQLLCAQQLVKKSSKLAEEDIGTVNRGFELEKDERKSHCDELTGHWMKLKMDPQGLIS